MIQPPFQSHGTPWQDELKSLITEGAKLLEALHLTPQEVGLSQEAAAQFACRVPRSFLAKMQVGNPCDPLLLQVLPSARELDEVPGFSTDPLEEAAFNPIPGLLHKYHGRVLLTAAPSCAVNCRYCFRRHFPYADNSPGTQGWQAALDYIRQNTSIEEVILSGGDPLMLPDQKFLALAQACADIEHVTTLRIHSRLPIVIPNRLTQGLLESLSALRVEVVLVLHCNHPAELDPKLALLRTTNITVLNQAVLLRGVNDTLEVQVGLSKRLFELGILPYYLHLLDPIKGAAHFDVPLKEAQALYAELQAHLPGYLVPKLAQERPGARNKVTVASLEASE